MFAPILMGLTISFGIIRFAGVTNVTGCYSVTPPATMLQNTCKIKGFKKNMVYRISSWGWGGGRRGAETSLIIV